MSFKMAMMELIKFSASVIEKQDLTSEQLHEATRKIIAANVVMSSLRKREQFAINEIVSAMFAQITICETTLVYEYNGKKYSIHKDKIPGCLSTDELHKMGLLSDVWDSMRKTAVWIRTGNFYNDLSF